MEIWFCVIISFVIVGATLSVTGFKLGRATYWLLSIMLEQGANLQSRWKPSNALAIFSCMYMAIVLKNFYTSTMYSNLIEPPEAKNIPESIYELFSSTIKHKVDTVFVESSFKTKLVNYLHKIGEDPSYGIFHSDFLNGMIKHTRHVERWWRENHANNISQYQPVSCSKHPFKAIEKCDTSKRIGLVYKTMGDWENRDKEFRFLKTVVSLLGGRKYKEPPSQKIFLSDRMFWYFADVSYLIENFQGFVSIVEQSGIASKVKIDRDIAIQKNKLKESNSKLENGKPWNFFAYSVLHSKMENRRQNGGSNFWKLESAFIYEPIKIENFVVIMTLFAYMFAINILVLLVELLIFRDKTKISIFKWRIRIVLEYVN